MAALAGAITSSDGSRARVLGEQEFWEQNLDAHFRVVQADVSPQKCANQLGWSTLTVEGILVAGSKVGPQDHVAFVAVSADRDDMLSLSFNAIARLEDCSPLRITAGGQTATATYRHVTAYTDADVTHAVIASLTPPSGAVRHLMRVAAKSGTLFVQASANIDSPDNFRAESERLSGLVNQVLAAQKKLVQPAV